MRTRSLRRALAGSALLLAACATDDAGPTTTVAPSLDDLAAGEAGYEMVVDSLGADLRRRIATAPTVGDTQIVEVRIAADSDEDSQNSVDGGTVAAEIRVEVEMAGQTHRLGLAVDDVDATDDRLALQMARGKGSTVTVERDEAAVVTSTTVNVTGSPDDLAAEWIERLLLTPAALMGPIPVEPLGEGARWTVTVQDADGTRLTRMHELVALADDRYVIVIEGDDGSAVLEGQIGRPIPERQEVDRGRLTITTNVVHTVSN